MSKKSYHQQSGQQTEQDTREDRLELEGKIEECLPGTLFKVATNMGTMVLATLSGKLRLNKIRLLPGDNVVVEVSPYDTTKGRVVWRR